MQKIRWTLQVKRVRNCKELPRTINNAGLTIQLAKFQTFEIDLDVQKAQSKRPKVFLLA